MVQLALQAFVDRKTRNYRPVTGRHPKRDIPNAEGRCPKTEGPTQETLTGTILQRPSYAMGTLSSTARGEM